MRLLVDAGRYGAEIPVDVVVGERSMRRYYVRTPELTYGDLGERILADAKVTLGWVIGEGKKWGAWTKDYAGGRTDWVGSFEGSKIGEGYATRAEAVEALVCSICTRGRTFLVSEVK